LYENPHAIAAISKVPINAFSTTFGTLNGTGLLGQDTLPNKAGKVAAALIYFPRKCACGVRGLLVYCSDYRCSHWTAIDRWPDGIPLSDLEPRFVCKACGLRGADIRPDFPQTRMGTGQ
jgi:hypothetical protein